MTPRAETDRALRLTLRLRWRFEELPVLLDLPDVVDRPRGARDDYANVTTLAALSALEGAQAVGPSSRTA